MIRQHTLLVFLALCQISIMVCSSCYVYLLICQLRPINEVVIVDVVIVALSPSTMHGRALDDLTPLASHSGHGLPGLFLDIG